MWIKVAVALVVAGIVAAVTVTSWVAYPTDADLNLPVPLEAATDADLVTNDARTYAKDLPFLTGGFRSQIYRSFAFLVLDTASYKYPFTWVPASLLYNAAHTRDGDLYRGVLFINAHDGSHRYARRQVSSIFGH